METKFTIFKIRYKPTGHWLCQGNYGSSVANFRDSGEWRKAGAAKGVLSQIAYWHGRSRQNFNKEDYEIVPVEVTMRVADEPQLTKGPCQCGICQECNWAARH